MTKLLLAVLALAAAPLLLRVAGQGIGDGLPFAVGAAPAGCDIGQGEWVRDEAARPAYQEWECPYIQPELTCQAHGRPDKDYQQWRWQPRGCSLPSFNATLMLEMLRGKRMLFVGDQLNRGQYLSLICMLHRAIPDGAKSFESVDSLSIFRAKNYDATIEFYWAPMLAETNFDNAVVDRVQDRVIRGAPMDKHSRFWKGANILVFNSYLWWMTGQKIQILRGADNDMSKDIVEMEAEEAYRLVLYQVVRWVEHNVDPKNSRVFFVTASPTHTDSREWGDDTEGGNCYDRTWPISEAEASYSTSHQQAMLRATGEVLAGSRVPVGVVNVTRLSEFRADAHTKTYKKLWAEPTPEQRADPRSYADCTHWCLPGVPDTWNELLYWKLFFPANDQVL
ncbi:hypothetical protein PR202_gb10482 [Eleusine coracana subsp. coracana]|uniref:Trichome birefringence-like N-terminal domain-containing protein n=1 Tax=Eleusine coracana subsp. coracana TaxID=191504 RepID=A0AAV5EJF2_ELECO|nr:hypothetical protein QOZ80_3BG0255910 [Eleusine coracana subsp. coracana]GJN22877.1 hypothetical protein PR202_gb10482 [Eleusine coracana subsp. coracana]